MSVAEGIQFIAYHIPSLLNFFVLFCKSTISIVNDALALAGSSILVFVNLRERTRGFATVKFEEARGKKRFLLFY
jgi:hypothetical protein